MEKVKSIIFFSCLLAIFVLCVKIFLESNIHKIFRQGKIFEIRCFYLLLSFAISTLCSVGIVKLIEAAFTIVG